MKEKTKITVISAIILTLFIGRAYGQDDNHAEHKKNELSLGAGLVYLPLEDAFTSGLNLHYVRGICHQNIFGLGISLETILDEHRHIFLALVTQINAYKGLKLSYSPGILFRNEALMQEVVFAHHVEITCEFELERFHLGPEIGIGKASDDWHFMLGVHGGIDF